jgi:hypothetical protein
MSKGPPHQSHPTGEQVMTDHIGVVKDHTPMMRGCDYFVMVAVNPRNSPYRYHATVKRHVPGSSLKALDNLGTYGGNNLQSLIRYAMSQAPYLAGLEDERARRRQQEAENVEEEEEDGTAPPPEPLAGIKGTPLEELWRHARAGPAVIPVPRTNYWRRARSGCWALSLDKKMQADEYAQDDREVILEFQEENGEARYRAHYLELQEEFVEEPEVGEYGPYWLLPVEEWAVTKERKVQRC